MVSLHSVVPVARAACRGRAASPGVAYAAAGAALTGATVAIHRDGGVYDYLRDPVTDGRYLPPPGADMVAPDTVYELRVLIVGEPEVRATTRTPARVRIADVILLDDTFENEVRSLRRFEEIGDGVYDAPENQLNNQEIIEWPACQWLCPACIQ